MRKAYAIGVMVASLAGCHARLADGDPLTGDGGIEGDGGEVPDAPPLCASGRAVYLNFEGQSLTRAMPSDATANTASWMTQPSGTVPAYHAASGTRAAEIDAIVVGIRTQLASFPVDVVTTRPATGPYVMIVFGGNSNQSSSRYPGAVNTLDCGDATKSDVAWISDGVTPAQKVVNFAVGAIGFGLGLTATSTPTDCMCGWANGCISDNAAACTLGSPIDRDTAANQICPGLTTQDETAAFGTTFCQ